MREEPYQDVVEQGRDGIKWTRENTNNESEEEENKQNADKD